MSILIAEHSLMLYQELLSVLHFISKFTIHHYEEVETMLELEHVVLHLYSIFKLGRIRALVVSFMIMVMISYIV